MKQVVIVGGGETFDMYEDYLRWLRTTEFDIFSKASGWKSNLQEDLGPEYQVFNLRMPNPNNASYLEWRIYFTSINQHFERDAVFVGHSLGGLFLLQYLSEYNLVPRATIIVGTPAYDCGTFKYPLGGKGRNLGKLHLFHSEDDNIVPLRNAYLIKSDILSAHMHINNGSGHFYMQTNFPALVKVIKSLWPKSPKQNSTASSKS